MKPAVRGLISFVAILAAGTSVAQQPSEAERAAGAIKALDYLGGRFAQGGLTHPSGADGRVVVHSTAGLAFLAAGSTLDQGSYRRPLIECTRYVVDNVAAKSRFDENWDQSIWAYAHATIFVAHLHHKATPQARKKIETELRKYVKVLVDSQTDRGGWCHGQRDIPNALGYTDLVATTNLALFGLGYARQAGVEVPEETLVAGLKYLYDSSDGKGAVGYSPRRGQKGYPESGRCAGAILAYRAIGAARRTEFPMMMQYLGAHLGTDLNRGHGSAQLGLMQAAWACHLAGESAWNEFWSQQGASILSRQQADGSIHPPAGERLPGEPDEQGPDVGRMREVDDAIEGGDRATATHALILALPGGMLGNRGGPLSLRQRTARLEMAVRSLGERAPDSATELLQAAREAANQEHGQRRLETLYRNQFRTALDDVARADADPKLVKYLLDEQLGLSTSVEPEYDAKTVSVTFVVTLQSGVEGVSATVRMVLPEGVARDEIRPLILRPRPTKPTTVRKRVYLANDLRASLPAKAEIAWKFGRTQWNTTEDVEVSPPLRDESSP